MRLNKFLSSCGIASRRKCDELISQGLVKVNGKVVVQLGVEVDKNDIVEFNGKRVELKESYVYYIFNKPKGCVTTSKDDRGRKTVLDYFSNVPNRIFCVGRLDYNTTGLLILTNDGEFANNVAHPKKHITKTYNVSIRGSITDAEIQKLQNGVVIDGKRTLPAKIKVIEQKPNMTKLEIIIFEGRNREIRKMFESINKLIVSLERVKIGELCLGDLARGEYKKVSKNLIEKCFN